MRTNLTWNGNGTITFYQKRIWHFEAALSNGSLSDDVTNLNAIVAVSHCKIPKPLMKSILFIDYRLLYKILQFSNEIFYQIVDG